MSRQADYVLSQVQERKIRFIRLWFTDVQGFLKSVSISPQELQTAFEEGMTFDGSSIDGYARVQEADMLAFPDPATFQILPWRQEEQVARMFCDIVTPDGEPFAGDPRTVLKKNLQRAADMGYTFYVAPELEYFYFADSGPEPQVLDRGGYFDLTPLDSAREYRRKTINALERMGIPIEHSHHEVAPSQHEIIVRYTDALTMADNIMSFRLTVKEVALAHGIYATFMPKPLEDHDGSGMHLHMSLFEGEDNVFVEEGAFTAEEGRKVLRAGLKHGLRPKVHADEFRDGGGAKLAASVGAISAEHLGGTGPAGIRAMARAGVVPVLLPATCLFLGLKRPDARGMIEAGCAVALATDFNPGSSPTENLHLVAALGCTDLGMTPEEVLSAITVNAAAAAGVESTRGRIAPGRPADLLVLDAPSYLSLPYRLGTNLTHLVVAGGKVVVERGRRRGVKRP